MIEREEEARRVLLRDAGYIIEDKLWRAYGTLRYARSLTFDEAMNFLSGVRLAVGLKLIIGLSVYTLNKLLIFSQSAHLSYAEGRPLTRRAKRILRAHDTCGRRLINGSRYVGVRLRGDFRDTEGIYERLQLH